MLLYFKNKLNPIQIWYYTFSVQPYCIHKESIPTCCTIWIWFFVKRNLIRYIFIYFKSPINSLITYPDLISSSVSLLRKICAYGDSSGYINQLHISLTNRQSSVRVLDTSASLFATSGYCMLNNYILALCVFCKAFILYVHITFFFSLFETWTCLYFLYIYF